MATLMLSGYLTIDAMEEMSPSSECSHRQNVGVLPTLRAMNIPESSEIIYGRQPSITAMVCGSLNIPLWFLPRLLVLACVDNFPRGISPGHRKII